MIVRWLGHSCFLFYSKKGTRVLADPFSEKLDYFFPHLASEVVLVSHEHPNHSATWRVLGEPYVIKRTTPDLCEFHISIPSTKETFIFKGIPTYHDEFLGRNRGPNTVYAWEMDELRVCHLGSLGHTLNENQVKNIGKIDILILPVGGNRILHPEKAAKVAKLLEAKLIFPTHFQTEFDHDLEKIETFNRLMTSVETIHSNQYAVTTLPRDPTVIQLKLPTRGKNGL